MNTNFKVIGLTRLRIKPESAATEADAFITRPPELLLIRVSFSKQREMLLPFTKKNPTTLDETKKLYSRVMTRAIFY